MCSYLDQVGATYYFRRAVPKDLVGHFFTNSGKPRTEWKFSLRTKDRETAKRCLRPHEIETDTLIDEARAALGSSGLTAPEVDATSRREREEAAAVHALAEERRLRHEARSDLRTLWHKRRRTSTAELEPEQAAAIDLLKEKDAELEQLRRAVTVMEAGNQALSIPTQRAPRTKPPVALGALFERYAASGTANPKTVSKWRSVVQKLIQHLDHEDAGRVTRADLNGWTASLVAQGLSKKTIVDGYLPAARAAFSIAYEDGTIPANPVTGLKVRAPKAIKLRDPDLTDREANTILAATLKPHPPRLASEHALARRWVPWLCAYTGARVGEITQLRAMDIMQDQGIWCIHITPEAEGGVKTSEARTVPLHSHLIEQGFHRLAKAGDTTPLFFREGAGNAVNPGSKIRAADLAKWVRTLGVTEVYSPNHGWRHRFKTLARLLEIPEYLADKIQGHAPPNQGRKYGSVPLVTMRNAIEKLPAYRLDGAAGASSMEPLEDTLGINLLREGA
ncbi:DUF6538 domain-containing protein [Aurantiacibacter hainanensis]|uniref:DUF6538 domain-containing protein n=1 Tax=Aurantiacibacter hainanensis TaxID=3076114 RepID=UPI0030C75FF0